MAGEDGDMNKNQPKPDLLRPIIALLALAAIWVALEVIILRAARTEERRAIVSDPTQGTK